MTLNSSMLKNLIEEGDIVIVGVSGGADSMCLLSLVEEFKEVDYDFYVVHINHNLRGDESDKEESFVKAFCYERNIKFKSVQVNVKEVAEKEKKTIEQAARDLRYEALKHEALFINANKILVAHHGGDQVETVLMHIARGSSLNGAKGMMIKDKEIVRPLLNCSREEIELYLKEKKIPYINDSSNLDVKYTRNFIRHKIVPLFKEVYPNFEKSVCSFAKRCACDSDFIESLLPLNLLTFEKNKVYFDDSVKDLHISLSSRLIKKAFEHLGVYSDLEEKHIEHLLNLFNNKNGNKINLVGKTVAVKEYNRVVLLQEYDVLNCEEKEFNIGHVRFENFGNITVEKVLAKEKISFNNKEHFVDFDKVPKGVKWRSKRDGDLFVKFGSGKKKLSDYFTDKKVPKRLRNLIPVLAKGNEVFIVAGMEISEKVKITKQSKNIVKIIYKK